VSDVTTVNLWNRACEHLQTQLHKDVYSRWIAVIDPVSYDDDLLTLSVDNDFYQTWLEDNYLALIRNALQAETGTPVKIRFTIQPVKKFTESAALGSPPSAQAVRSAAPRKGSSQKTPPLNPKYIFDEFIVGPSNSFVHAACLAVAQAPAKAYNPLFIYGGCGLGKTHIMQAIGHHVLSTTRKSVSYISSETLLNEYIEALGNRTLPQFRRNYRTTDLLLIDDIQFLAGKDRLQEEFFHTFNALFDAHKQIVMTSDRPACEIAGLEQRLVSRFEWGIVTELESPDFETRMAILLHKLKQVNLLIADDLLLFIAKNVRSNIRRLEGALVRAVSYMSLTGHELTLESLKYLLRDTLEDEQQESVTFDDIQKTVAEHYDIRLSDMTSKHRPRSVAVPRQVAMYLCRRMTSSSLPQIAAAFHKTHATVLHAYRSVNSRMDVDAQLKNNIHSIAKKLGARL
jgi:chromosomal replication initiator protein